MHTSLGAISQTSLYRFFFNEGQKLWAYRVFQMDLYDLKHELIFSHVYDFLKMVWILTEICKTGSQEEKYLTNIFRKKIQYFIKEIGYWSVFAFHCFKFFQICHSIIGHAILVDCDKMLDHGQENKQYPISPHWKTTSHEDDLTGRRPQRKATSKEDDLTGRRPHRKTTSQEEDITEDDITGRRPHRKMT